MFDRNETLTCAEGFRRPSTTGERRPRTPAPILGGGAQPPTAPACPSPGAVSAPLRGFVRARRRHLALVGGLLVWGLFRALTGL